MRLASLGAERGRFDHGERRCHGGHHGNNDKVHERSSVRRHGGRSHGRACPPGYGRQQRGPEGERASLDEDENTRDESTPAKWLQT